MSRIRLSLPLIAALSTLLAAGCSRQEANEEPHGPRGVLEPKERLEQLAREGNREDATRLFRMGEVPTALRILDRLQSADPSGSGGDEARLMIATLLMSQRRHSEAVPLLERVAENGAVAPDHARALLVEAIVEGGLGDRLESAVSIASAQLQRRAELQSPLLAERFNALLVRAAAASGDHRRVSAAGTSYLAEWAHSPRSDEVRWLTGQALERLGRSADAGDVYSHIWFETPRSPWAKQAHERLRSRFSSAITRRRTASAERLAFVERLQGAGLHEEALDELARVGAGASRAERARALALTAESLLAVRRKDRECVEAVERMRQLAPRSTETAAAGLVAIRALRRIDDLEAIRQWRAWIERTFPDSAVAVEARYNLATFLLSSDRYDEAIELLLSVAGVPEDANADNALWKLVWAYRKQGRDDQVQATLKRILADFPKSGFRKAALYWLARFVAPEDRGAAVGLYRTLLREFPQDYYGHEATRSLLALKEAVSWTDYGDQDRAFPAIDRLDDPTRRLDADAYARAVSLARVGLFAFAADELETLPDVERDQSLNFALADLRTRAGDTWSGVEILKRSFGDYLVAGSRDTRVVPEDFWYVAYPFNYRSLIEEAVREAGLDSAQIEPALVASLIRMESCFLPSAVSPVGAVGLMQLMPGTANELAHKMTGGNVTRAELFEPEINIRYGTRYLADRVADFRGEWFPAICSYNAGVKPVRQWWAARRLDMPMDEFIEGLPYEATRLYVKQVLGDYRNYEWIYYQGQRGDRTTGD